jgi:Predicted EndoIII-related endonuclease
MVYVDSQESAGSELIRKARQVAERLEAFYGRPDWREPLQPLDELVSTILSQNTNDRNRDLAFQRLKARFPSWEAVRDAETGQVIDAIRIAGLANQKGPRMQEVLRQITTERGSLDLVFLRDLPPEEVRSWLVRFKGVGPKTASIVMQFSLGMSAFPVDTHIYRVSGRIGLRPARMTVEQAHVHLAGLFSPDSYGPVHLNLIRLGREICQARRPNCPACPLKEICDYYPAVYLPSTNQ